MSGFWNDIDWELSRKYWALVVKKRGHGQHGINPIANKLANLVGYIGIGLPLVLILGVLFWSDEMMRDSISAFYYSVYTGTAFVGALFFIGAFLWAYEGEHPLQTVGSSIAGVWAVMVAVFPTSHDGIEAEDHVSRVFGKVGVESTGTPSVDIVVVGDRGADPSNPIFFNLFQFDWNWHLIAAALLFLYLAFYCLVMLRLIVIELHIQNGQLIETKRNRNRYYATCGALILVFIGTIGVAYLLEGCCGTDLTNWDRFNLTFIFEGLALWAFAAAWFAKGRRIRGLADQRHLEAMSKS